MSTRANIFLLEKGNKLWLYHHFDGCPQYLGGALMEVLEKHKGQEFFDIYDLANELVKQEDDNGYELTSKRHGDIDYLYVIDMCDKTIKCIKTTPFEDDLSDRDLIEANYENDEDIKKWFDFCKKN